MAKRYILSDESLNSYKFRVITAGIDIESRYMKNPVILFQHDNEIMSVGKMKIWKEGSVLMGEPEFDVEDEIGKELNRKYERGFMNGFSIGIDPVELSDSPENLIPGQQRMTITKSELIEVSVANVPSNKNAVRLSSGDINDVPNIKKSTLEMKKIALFYGLAESSTEEEILAKLTEQKSEIETLKREKSEADEKLAKANEEISKTKTNSLEAALSNQKKSFTAEQKETFRKLAAVDYENAMKLIGMTPDKQSLSEFAKGGDASGEKKTEKTWKQLSKENPKFLEDLKTSNPDEFKRLFKDEFGKEPKI